MLPFILYINIRNGANISGVVEWPSLDNSKTKMRGALKPDGIQFEEYEITKARAVHCLTSNREGLMFPSHSMVKWIGRLSLARPKYPQKGG